VPARSGCRGHGDQVEARFHYNERITAILRVERLSAPATALLRDFVRASGRRAAPVLVGGTVRDAFLGRASVDLDVAVARGAFALAERVRARLDAAVVPLDPERGVVRLLARGHRLDLSDFRASTVAGDLAERDYTANALGVALGDLLSEGRAPVIDPTGGLADLRARRLRLTGEPALRDDPLRGLRGVRLEAALGLRLVPATRRLIRVHASDLARVSMERVRDELLAILGLARAAPAVRRMDALGLLTAILPEVEPMRRTVQPAPHRFPVLEHSLRALAAADRLLGRLPALRPVGPGLVAHMQVELGGGVARSQTLKLAALLHDVAKPETRRLVQGRIRFFDHDVLGAERAWTIATRLRLPGRVAGVLERLVRHHLRPMHLAQAGTVTRRARYRFFRDLGDEASDLLLLALADGAAVRGESPFATWRRSPLVRDLFEGWDEERAVSAAPRLLRGEDVMDHFGIPPGPTVGQLLARAREAQALGRVGTREEALAFLDSSGRRP
jgi:putative nucleotidyltransferase with HDIG domain